MSAMANEADAIYVIDDFLRAPEVLRRFGLDAEYPKPPVAETYAGRHSKDVYPIPGLDQQIARITGHAVVPVKHPAVHGRFRLCLADEVGTGGVHIDNSHWTGVLFLTLDEDAHGGTDFFRHRETNTLRAPVYPEDWAAWGGRNRDQFWKEVVVPQTNDPTKWELVRRVPMKFNRLVLFRPWQWHNATPGFGDRPENGRLIYVLVYHDA
jgi:hypothetical protein